jgi:hypothetical protein
MFADDLIMVGSQRDLERADRLLKDWSKETLMVINFSKCGAMPLYKSRLGARKSKEFCEYPVVEEYRYLGLMMGERLTMVPHLREVQRKVQYITNTLMPLRIAEDINLNLYKAMVLPLYWLCFALYPWTSEKQKEAVRRHMRVTTKRFLIIPRNTSKELLDIMMGGYSELIDREIRTIESKIEARKEWRREYATIADANKDDSDGCPFESEHEDELRPKEEQADEKPETLVLPKKLPTLLRYTYGSICKAHRHVMNTTHLREEHSTVDVKTGQPKAIDLDIPRLIRRSQNAKIAGIVNSQIKNAIRILEEARESGKKTMGRGVGKVIDTKQSSRSSCESSDEDN